MKKIKLIIANLLLSCCCSVAMLVMSIVVPTDANSILCSAIDAVLGDEEQ